MLISCCAYLVGDCRQIACGGQALASRLGFLERFVIQMNYKWKAIGRN